MTYQRVGIIGAGVIGHAIFDAIVTQNLAAVDYVLVDERFAPPADATRLREHLVTDSRWHVVMPVAGVTSIKAAAHHRPRSRRR